MPKRFIKRLLKEELDLIDNGYKLLTSFVTEGASHKYAEILWEEGWYAQIVDRVLKYWQEFRVYAKPKNVEDWEDIPRPPADEATATVLNKWRKRPPRRPGVPVRTHPQEQRRAPS